VSRCPACPGKHNCVPPSGPVDRCNDYMCLGEAPGRDEDKKLQPFVGKTGREVNEHYFPLAGWRRDNIRVDNAISCFPDRPKGKLDAKKQKDLDLLESCANHHLYPDLERLTPKLIVPMGAFACRALDPDIDLDLQHGILTETAWGPAFPMWHPAGGIHEPKKMLHIRTDWTRLRKHLIGKLHREIDQYAGREIYKVISDPQELRWLLSDQHTLPMACDTETKKGGAPFCLTFSTQPGTGFLIMADDTDTLRAYQEALDVWEGPILFHNWLFDGPIVAKMGLRFRRRLIRDTMVMSFHLGNLPQGLKALAWRELGMRMQDFDDMVTPYSRDLVIEYYRQAYAEVWQIPDPVLKRQDDGSFKLYKAQGFNRKLKTFFNAWDKNPDKDVFEMWTKNWTDEHQMVEDMMGPWPGKCITHAWARNPEQVTFYACRDADTTLRLYPLLMWMRRQVRYRPQENWSEGWWESAA